MRINYKLYRGTIAKNLIVNYVYTFEETGDFKTVYQRDESSTVYLNPSFGISISLGYEKDRVYVTSNLYYTFTGLLETSVKLISENLYELFPNAGRAEFEINPKSLERFMTEKAIANNGITMVPCVYVDEMNQCYPGIHISTLKNGSIKLPFQDVIPLSKLLSSIDPHLMSLSMLRIMGKVN